MRRILYLLIVVFSQTEGKIRIRYPSKHQRHPSAFSLARLQRDYDDYDDGQSVDFPRDKDNSWRRHDEVVTDAECLRRCNSRLNVGMDMVNAHMAFGSIDVPSVAEPRDLELFCMLDRQHSQCIDECGYSVQFNLREYVCRHRYNEMLTYQPCYTKAAPVLLRYCRPRCGGYAPLDHSLSGYAKRCRQLLCDHTCINFILERVCGENSGTRASNFLLDFSRLQVEYWIRDFAKVKGVPTTRAYPASCARLQCDGFKNSDCRAGKMG